MAAAAKTTLPRFLVLYSESGGGKYVSYVSEEGGKLNQILAARGKQVASPHSKFEVVQSAAHPSMVHIRCCYNNKFLRQRSETERWIVAAAEEAEDDQTNWSCTLFKPELSAAEGVVRLLHAHQGRYVQWYDDSSHLYSNCLWAQSLSAADPKTPFQVIDWESLVTLPKYVAFTGDNNSYLGLRQESGAALVFDISDPKDKTIANEVVALPDGTFQIKNVSRGGFWRLNAPDESDNAIWADTTTAPSQDSVFRALKMDGTTVVLRNIGNNKLCKRYNSAPLFHQLLRAIETEPTRFTKLRLTELVASRRIVDFKFHLNDGWIYNKTPNVVLHNGINVTNETDEAQTETVEIPYKDFKSCTWKGANSSFELGPAVHIKPDQIPYISDAPAVELTTPFAPSFVWGETTGHGGFDQVYKHEVTLPPWTKVTLRLSATKATCDVPLTYTRYDTDEIAGHVEAHIMDDGVYTGTNYFDFKVDVTTPVPIAKKN